MALKEQTLKQNFQWQLESSVLKSFLAGATSGTISCVLFQPLDLIKTRLQSDGALHHRTGSEIATRPTISATVYNVIYKENITGLWKGLTPSLYRTVPGVGMYFCTLHFMKSFWRQWKATIFCSDVLYFKKPLLYCTVMYVIFQETIAILHCHSDKFNYTTVPQALRLIWKLEGIRGLFSGFMATLARDAPYSGLYLMFYSQQKSLLKTVTDKELGARYHFSCGIVAGLLASLVTHPADVVKTQLQLFPSRYTSTGHCVKTIFEKYGATGFFRGVIPRCLRRTLLSALSWTVFEELMKRLNLKV